MNLFFLFSGASALGYSFYRRGFSLLRDRTVPIASRTLFTLRPGVVTVVTECSSIVIPPNRPLVPPSTVAPSDVGRSGHSATVVQCGTALSRRCFVSGRPQAKYYRKRGKTDVFWEHRRTRRKLFRL